MVARVSSLSTPVSGLSSTLARLAEAGALRTLVDDSKVSVDLPLDVSGGGPTFLGRAVLAAEQRAERPRRCSGTARRGEDRYVPGRGRLLCGALAGRRE